MNDIQFKGFRTEKEIFDKMKSLTQEGLPEVIIVDLYNPPRFLERNKSVIEALYKGRMVLKFFYYCYFFPKFFLLERKLKKALKAIKEDKAKALDMLNKDALRIHPWGGIRFLLRLGENYFKYNIENKSVCCPIVFVNSMYLLATESIWNLYAITPKLALLLDYIDRLFVETFGERELIAGKRYRYRYILDVPKIQERQQESLKPIKEIPDVLIDKDTTTLIEEIKNQIPRMRAS